MAGKVDVLAVLDRGVEDLVYGLATMWTAHDVRAMRDAVAELIDAGKRVTAAFRAIGNHKAPLAPAALRIEAEQAIAGLDAALSTTDAR